MKTDNILQKKTADSNVNVGSLTRVGAGHVFANISQQTALQTYLVSLNQPNTCSPFVFTISTI